MLARKKMEKNKPVRHDTAHNICDGDANISHDSSYTKHMKKIMVDTKHREKVLQTIPNMTTTPVLTMGKP